MLAAAWLPALLRAARRGSTPEAPGGRGEEEEAAQHEQEEQGDVRAERRRGLVIPLPQATPPGVGDSAADGGGGADGGGVGAVGPCEAGVGGGGEGGEERGDQVQREQQQQPGRLDRADVARAAGPLVRDEEAEGRAVEEEARVAAGDDQLEDGEATLCKAGRRLWLRVSGERSVVRRGVEGEGEGEG